MMEIKVLTSTEINELTNLYKECFKNDHYFRDFFETEDVTDIIETKFKPIFDFVLSKGNSYGLYDNGWFIVRI